MSTMIKKEILKELYIYKKLTQKQIATEFNVSRHTVQHWFEINGIEARSCSEAQKLRQKRERKIPLKSKLIDLYSYKKLGSYKLGRMFAVSHRTILNWLIEYNIPIRPREPKINFNQTPTLSYILGVISGDGSVFNYRFNKTLYSKVNLGVISKEFALSFNSSLRKIGFNPHMCTYKPKNGNLKYIVEANSKNFVNWYKQLSSEKLYEIIYSDKENMKSFIRGFYESEGTFRPKCCELRIRNTNKELILLCKNIIEKLSFKTTLTCPETTSTGKPYYSLYITGGRKQQYEFIKQVNPCFKRG
ncbi:MAG: helix-turn-helix domain-containing protein [Nanoarchaeota archaeon]|nr:helix-turn-helix domain-containing protein [Nanoarchaeota archaeon]